MTDDPARTLEGSRAVRDAARHAFDSRLAGIREGVKQRGLGRRVAESLRQDARETLDEALEVAGQSKGVIAATAAALAVWYLRHPILEALGNLIGRGENEQDEGDAHRE